MQGIEFEEDKDHQGLKAKTFETVSVKQGSIMRLMERIGFTDKSTANLVLLGIVALLFGAAIFLYAGILVEPAKNWSLDSGAIRAMTGQ